MSSVGPSDTRRSESTVSAGREMPSLSRGGIGLEGAARLALSGTCLVVAALAVVSWILVAVAHVRDSYGVDHVSGAWLGLAQRFGEGTLYPPLYDGESFGGTRFMPIPISLHGSLGYLIGDYLVAGKLIAYGTMAALLMVVVFVLRRERCPFPVAALLAVTLLVTGTGLGAATWIRHDTLPVVLQLLAVAAVTRSTSRRTLLAAAALCALALAAKLSALWAPMAIGLWLLARERSRLPTFIIGFLAFSIAVLGFFEALTHGRLTENVVELGFAGSRGVDSFAREQTRLRLIVGDGLGPVRLLVLLALLGAGLAVWRRRATLYQISLLVSLVVLAVVLTDRGAWSNHLLDLQVLSIVVLGAAWRELSPLLRPSLTLVVLAATIMAYTERAHPIRAARALLEADSSRLPGAARGLDPHMRLLSEDAYVPISLGQRPVVLDAFMLWSIARRDPAARDDLVRRLDAREFDAVVLFDRPEARATSADVRLWYDRHHFGREIVDAIERNYRAGYRSGGKWIYEPRPRP